MHVAQLISAWQQPKVLTPVLSLFKNNAEYYVSNIRHSSFTVKTKETCSVWIEVSIRHIQIMRARGNKNFFGNALELHAFEQVPLLIRKKKCNFY